MRRPFSLRIEKQFFRRETRNVAFTSVSSRPTTQKYPARSSTEDGQFCIMLCCSGNEIQVNNLSLTGSRKTSMQNVSRLHGSVKRLFTPFFTLFPETHVFHLFSAFTLQGFANQRCTFLVAPLLTIFIRRKAIFCKMLLCENLETFTGFKTSDGLFFDGFFGIYGYSGFSVATISPSLIFLMPSASFFTIEVISSSDILRTLACAFTISKASLIYDSIFTSKL